jgi:SNF2 family DNA or RNA helicase
MPTCRARGRSPTRSRSRSPRSPRPVEAQATDRAYRIGQQRKVQVHRFITRGTFEERINEMIRSKRELVEMTVGSGETWVGQLPPEELKALFRLG